MKYISTRDIESQKFSFEEVVLQGLSSDGGLFVPEEIPSIGEETLKVWKNLSFQELCLKLFSLFISPEDMPSDIMKKIVYKSFSSFTHEEVTPISPLGPSDSNFHLLELFHGPTFAFKDVALQFVGNVFDYYVNSRLCCKDKCLTVVGATSGDTGSAAIYGLRGFNGINAVILHPKNRISCIQEAQMTTVLDPNICNVAIEGTFDDCQDVVKQVLKDRKFRSQFPLAAVNSINWARILAQMSYYFYSFFKLDGLARGIRYSVPTGNFGDVLAGFYCKKMGLPIQKLIIGTNENDIICRFLKTGNYEKHNVVSTFSPAMDIQISSNFERFLWHVLADISNANKSTEVIVRWMTSLQKNGRFSVDEIGISKQNFLKACTDYFEAFKASDENIAATIKKYFRYPNSTLLDPHTAVGVFAAENIPCESSCCTVCLATAHPIKFISTVLKAAELTKEPDLEIEKKVFKGEMKIPVPIPEALKGIMDKAKRFETATASVDALKLIIERLSVKINDHYLFKSFFKGPSSSSSSSTPESSTSPASMITCLTESLIVKLAIFF